MGGYLRDQLVNDTVATVVALNDKVRTALDLGKPCEAADYASALKDAAVAYDVLDPVLQDDGD